MLVFEVALLTGRYVATAFNDRGAVEWPPHPARLFSALVATHFEALDPSEDERTALQWLERQGPPVITADDPGDDAGRDAATVFVPVNDTSVLGTLDDEMAEVDQARAALDAARKKGGRALAAAEKKLAKADEAMRKAIATAPPGKEGKVGAAKAASLLPEKRARQPRTFPSIAPAAIGVAEPRVVFAWPTANPSPSQRLTLDGLAERVVRLGHSSSFVTVRVREDHPAPTWVPDQTGTRPAAADDRMLRVVVEGQLAALCSAFASQADAPGRVLPASFQRYVRPAVPSKPAPPATVFGEDWVVLRRIDGPRLPSSRAVDVATTVRKAIMAAHGPGAPEILSGHRASGEAANRPHLAYIPLPFVGNEHADGHILGVA